MNKIKSFWNLIKQIAGEKDYENYLASAKHNSCKKKSHKLLTKKEFYAKKITEKWNGINLCC